MSNTETNQPTNLFLTATNFKMLPKASREELVAKVITGLNHPDPIKRRTIVQRGILLLLARQTDDEQQAETTEHHNCVGFTAADAKRLTFLGKWLQEGNHLTNAKVADYAKRLHKYRVQLAQLAFEKERLKLLRAANQPNT